MDTDKLYLENLEEIIYDDKSFVSYKHLSCKLKVHVNLAKQMLYEFLEQQKSKGKEIHAIYYISGVAPHKWIFPSDEDGYIGDGLLVMLCKDDELEDIKKRFTNIYSVHVYGLSAFPMTKSKLNDVANSKIVDDEERGAVHYGPMVCPTAFEFRPNRRLAISKGVPKIQEVKVKVKEEKDKLEKEQPLKKELNASKKTEPIVPPTRNQKTAAAGNQKDRLKNMFAAAANKPPKAEKVKVVEDKQSKATSSHEEDSEAETKRKESVGKKKEKQQSKKKKEVISKWSDKRKEKEAAKKKKEAETQSRKRKRIRDVFSDSESDSERKGSDEEDENFPESPTPKKRAQIQSDSEDDNDFKAPTKTSTEPSVENQKPPDGKRRVLKTRPMRHVDNEGFLVTVMENVMVTESDDSDIADEPASKKTKPSEQPAPEKLEKQDSKIKTIKSNIKEKETPKKASSTNTAGKGKQSSLMSFFKKL